MTEQENERPDIQQDNMTERQMSFLDKLTNESNVEIVNNFLKECRKEDIRTLTKIEASNLIDLLLADRKVRKVEDGKV